MNKCLCCGYEWKSKKRSGCSTNNNSRNCPKCFSYIWDIGNNAKCYCCGKTILNPAVHHKNGNHFDNSKANRIAICNFCHLAVHNNISRPKKSKRTGMRRYAKKKIMDKINELKRYLVNG